MEELAQRLNDAGFPAITRWSIENNTRRPMTVIGKPAMPLLQELISELPKDVDFVLFKYEEKWFAESGLLMGIETKQYADTQPNRDAGYSGKTYYSGYIDDRISGRCYGENPEIAVGELWLTVSKLAPLPK